MYNTDCLNIFLIICKSYLCIYPDKINNLFAYDILYYCILKRKFRLYIIENYHAIFFFYHK